MDYLVLYCYSTIDFYLPMLYETKFLQNDTIVAFGENWLTFTIIVNLVTFPCIKTTGTGCFSVHCENTKKNDTL